MTITMGSSWRVFIVLVSAMINAFLINAGGQQGPAANPCANQKWRFNPQACLNFVKDMTDDPDLYYFGNKFTKDGCNYSDTEKIKEMKYSSRDVRCYNVRPTISGTYLTMGSRIFNDNDYRSSQYLSKLNSILETQFISPPEMAYTGCNTTAQLPTTTVVDVYPGMPPVPSVMLRKPPRINPVGCTFSQLCTIIFRGVGDGITHNVWSNWPKENNFSDFRRPRAVDFNADPYVLLAYYQQGEIKVDPKDLEHFDSYEFSIQDFAKKYDLQGPFAINWVNAVVDISIQDEFVQLDFMNGCPLLLEELTKQDALILNKDLGLTYPLNLNTWFVIKYDNEQYQYTSCCNQFQTPKKEVWIDALRNGRVAVEDVRNKPTIILQSSKMFPDPNKFAGQTHMLLLVQPDISMINPLTGKVVDAEVFVFWMLYNIANGDLSSGTEKLSYLEPMLTPARPANRFYYVLLSQKGNFDTAKLESYLNTSCGPDAFNQRCRFPLSRFANENDMKIVGISRFRLPETAAHQPFVRYLWVKYNVTNEDQACGGAPNYPCKKAVQTRSLG